MNEYRMCFFVALFRICENAGKKTFRKNSILRFLRNDYKNEVIF
jgi:hypothetical protein